MINIRPLLEKDIEPLAVEALEDWQEIYSGFMPEADIEHFVKEAYDPDRIKEMIPRITSGKMGFWVAEQEGKLLGWIQIADFGGGMEIGRSGLRSDEVASSLIGEAESWLRQKGATHYFSYVDIDDDLYKFKLEANGFIHLPAKDDHDDRYLEKRL